MDVQFTSFTDETSMPKRPPSHVEKIYERRYMLDYGEPGHDYWICAHPNGVCVMGMCSTHTLFQQLRSADDQVKQLPNIKFSEINGQGLSSIKANGKKMSKRDGVWTKKDTIICTITAAGADDRQPVAFECPAVIEGKVLQVNTNLQTHPGPFIDRPYDDGYLLVSCLFPEQRKKMLEQWPSAEEFCLTRSLHQDDVRGGYVVRK